MNNNFAKVLKQNQIQPQDIEGVESSMIEKDLVQLEKYFEDNIVKIFYLEKVYIDISSDDEKSFHVSPVESGSIKKETNAAFLSLIKAKQKKYFIIITDAFLSKILDREPYLQSLQEYQFQSQLSKIFKLKHLQAYDTDVIKSEQEIMDSEAELNYCEGKQFSFIIYPI